MRFLVHRWHRGFGVEQLSLGWCISRALNASDAIAAKKRRNVLNKLVTQHDVFGVQKRLGLALT